MPKKSRIIYKRALTVSFKQQLQYQKVFQKHNQHQLPHNTKNHNNLADLPTAESRQLKVSAAGIPMEDSEYYVSDEKNHPFHSSHHQNHHLDDEHIIDDGETSQLDLVEYASKN